MNDVIELWNGAAKALISIDGGWLTNLSDDSGDILFPKRSLAAEDGSKKQRGGCHVCLPNFGPGGLSDQAQHGFGRQMVWSVARQTTHSVTLELPHGDDEYADMSSQISYLLGEQSLTITLKVVNNGAQNARVSPGFHPYFSLAEGESRVTIDSLDIDLSELADTEFFEGTSKELITQKRTITLSSNELTTWAAWTDQMGTYVCLEPTRAGYSFLDSDEPPENEIVAPGSSRSYEFLLQW